MGNEVMINCPNCNKRTFADKKECIYCNFNLKGNEHDFDSQIYELLYSKYNESKNKPEAIKEGMEQFGISMKEAKEIVDHISEHIYYKEESEKNKEVQKNRDEKMEELPTNGIDYSKYYNTDSISYYTGFKKFLPIKILGLIVYWIILGVMWAKEFGSGTTRVIATLLSIILCIKTISRSEVPLNPHTYVSSFFEYFIHCILPGTIVMIPLWAIISTILIFVTNSPQPIFTSVLVGVVIFFIFLIKFAIPMPQEFTVDYGVIRYYAYKSSLILRGQATHPIDQYYDIYYIREVKETLNSIIIYGDIEKTIIIYGNRWKKINLSVVNTSKEKINKLKITKGFKNNKNLIKSLKIRAYEFNKTRRN